MQKNKKSIVVRVLSTKIINSYKKSMECRIQHEHRIIIPFGLFFKHSYTPCHTALKAEGHKEYHFVSCWYHDYRPSESQLLLFLLKALLIQNVFLKPAPSSSS